MLATMACAMTDRGTGLRHFLGAALDRRRQRRSARLEAQVRASKARRSARAQMGVVSIPRQRGIDHGAIERHTTELRRSLISWSREQTQPAHIVSVEVPPALPNPGERFVVRGRAADGRQLLVLCQIVRRPPWRRSTDLVKFAVLDADAGGAEQ